MAKMNGRQATPTKSLKELLEQVLDQLEDDPADMRELLIHLIATLALTVRSMPPVEPDRGRVVWDEGKRTAHRSRLFFRRWLRGVSTNGEDWAKD